tara:strand:+ start:236 stop:892 length:657 start_codon:yes stop_codon:yes gene_type:complete
MKKVIFLDAGHGSVDKKGIYTTQPDRMFNHREGVFHYNSIFYEGFKNREYCELIKKKLNKEGITVIPVYHPYEDTSIHNRVYLANWYHTNICPGIYISEHSNSTLTHKTQGFQIWTSKGHNKSDKYGNILLKLYEKKFEMEEYSIDESLEDDISKLLTDDEDDEDQGDNFYVLYKTKMPAILLENLFFDNFEDASMLMEKWYKEKYTDLIVEWLKKIV